MAEDIALLTDLEAELQSTLEDGTTSGKLVAFLVTGRGPREVLIYADGPDARALFETLRPVLLQYDFSRLGAAMLRYEPGDYGYGGCLGRVRCELEPVMRR